MEHQSHESGIPAGKVFTPECAEDGSYKPKQCHYGNGECWCVDSRGFELSRTRTKEIDALSCDPTPRSEECPLYKCKEDCEHGFELDEKGELKLYTR